ncbi:hypothetical protein [Ruminococcus sp.]|jgi:rRNA maturation endonuclease Nob1|uniref:hypothetical protein n=1 Tax=Ruminococcus sp. TaxID=41978 RepID=UPI0025CCA353|nr:hypothetical protein [Ruminococcus sp.]
MFYNCPNCSQLIKEDADTCPFCKHIIKVTDPREKKREELVKEAEKIKENKAINIKRIKLRILFIVLYLVISFGSLLLMVSLDVSSSWMVGIFVSLTAIFLVLVFNLSIFRCPYCDKILNHPFYDHCPHCGGRLL